MKSRKRRVSRKSSRPATYDLHNHVIPETVVQAIRRRRMLVKATAAAMPGMDAILLPTAPDPAPKLGELAPYFGNERPPYMRPFNLPASRPCRCATASMGPACRCRCRSSGDSDRVTYRPCLRARHHLARATAPALEEVSRQHPDRMMVTLFLPWAGTPRAFVG